MTKQKFKRISKVNNKEFWLEYGKLQRDQNNYQDMLWYNEGRTDLSEIVHFVGSYLKNLFRKDLYYIIRILGIKIYLRK